MSALATREAADRPAPRLEQPAARPREGTGATILRHPALEAEGTPSLLHAELHRGVITIMAGCFAAMMLAFWITFRAQAEAAFMVAISGFYLAMYVGTPFVMLRIAARHRGPVAEPGSLGDFLRGALDTATGPLSGRDALAQVCAIPGALALATIGICAVIAAS